MQVRPDPGPLPAPGDDRDLGIGRQAHQPFDEDVLQGRIPGRFSSAQSFEVDLSGARRSRNEQERRAGPRRLALAVAFSVVPAIGIFFAVALLRADHSTLRLISAGRDRCGRPSSRIWSCRRGRSRQHASRGDRAPGTRRPCAGSRPPRPHSLAGSPTPRPGKTQPGLSDAAQESFTRPRGPARAPRRPQPTAAPRPHLRPSRSR